MITIFDTSRSGMCELCTERTLYFECFESFEQKTVNLSDNLKKKTLESSFCNYNNNTIKLPKCFFNPQNFFISTNY